ncbi:hypothetical protein ACQIBV_004213 [Yersinia enterocolitica]|uniref:hypothetical protein n=1 Tax=Yersinia TaxID=629 RepID=UPI0011A9C50E|nr:hypothetical protein [Yersinia alsatica]EKN3395625.1 hypothetical protein [Yersinia enterocolitica]EKN3501187.1 hypothetical protein [Yersinia enterocolitica]EKN3636639.1 hypothetical protein [Yersinia enterocolitica]EKN3687201.1 hypothetical protein [Yersinia enterocolitica]EKN3832536.1 hypothetical protein [Yersinia enterocolitica]
MVDSRTVALKTTLSALVEKLETAVIEEQLIVNIDMDVDLLLSLLAVPQIKIECREQLLKARERWLMSNDPCDGTDVVTPYDAYLYV